MQQQARSSLWNIKVDALLLKFNALRKVADAAMAELETIIQEYGPR
jgi:hypothetical protein